MRRVCIDDPAAEGALLVRDLRAPGGEILARAGMRLTARSARALRELGACVCFIEDAGCIGLDVRPLVDLHDRDQGLVRALRDLCGVAAPLAHPLTQQSTSRALQSIADLRVVQRLDSSGALEGLRHAVTSFVEHQARVDAASGFLTDRQATDDLVGHSVGVAALAVRIASELGFTDADLHATALASATHDLGLLMVPEEVRRIPVAQRTAGQQRRYEDHTALGEALLKPLERRSPAVPLVAVEHHEEQAGGGYPHGLTGGNRVLRSALPGQRRLTLVSEIVAVADRYERLLSGAPGERPLGPAAARHVLGAEAGPKLNAEVVGRFLDLLPRWPLGTEVILRGGAHHESHGVVVKPDGTGGDRPTVRVFATPAGTVTPTDVDLAREGDVSVELADERVAA